MNSAIERMLGLRVKDVMTDQVLAVAESDDMQSVARRMADAGISGVPVVDAHGVCIGMLSASDFVSRDAGRHDVEVFTQNRPDEAYHVERLNDNLVATHMTPFVQTISDDAPILGAARVMCHEGIHRLVVLNEAQQPVGIVSSLDLVASMIAAIEE